MEDNTLPGIVHYLKQLSMATGKEKALGRNDRQERKRREASGEHTTPILY